MRRLLTWAGILGGAIPVMAQTPAPSAPSTTVRHEVLVTASSVTSDERAVPATTETMERDEVERRQARTVSDLLRYAAGVDVVRSGSPGKVTSLFVRGTESDHTLVLWNGVELNSPYFGGFDWAFLPTDGVERVEIVRGPTSALYGSDALGGVVQVFTGGSDRRTVSMEAGSNSYRRGAFVGQWRRSASVVDLVAGVRRGEGELGNDFFDGEHLAAGAEWNLGESAGAGIRVRALGAEVGIPNAGGLPSPERRSSLDELQVAAPIHWVGDRWVAESLFSLYRTDASFRDPQDAFGFTFSETETESRRVRSVARRAIGTEHRWAVGAEWESQDVHDRSSFGAQLMGEDQTTRAAFTEWLWTGDRWTLDLSARWDDHTVFGDHGSPRAGLAWRLASGHRVRVAYGESFRAPSLGELFFPFSGNPNLEPEEGSSWEVAYDWDRPAWKVVLAAFGTDLENLIDFDFVSFRNVNIGSARTRGLELSTQARGSGRLMANGNATWLDTEDGLGRPLLRRPRFRAHMAVTWQQDRWEAQALLAAVGRRDDVDPANGQRVDNPSYQTVGLNLRWTGLQRWTPHARIENLLEDEYEEAKGFPAPGRTVALGASVRF